MVAAISFFSILPSLLTCPLQPSFPCTNGAIVCDYTVGESQISNGGCLIKRRDLVGCLGAVIGAAGLKILGCLLLWISLWKRKGNRFVF